VIWAFKKVDLPRVARYFGFQQRGEIPLLGEDEIAVSGPGLAKVFLMSRRKIAEEIRSKLDRAARPGGNRVLLSDVVYERRRIVNGTLWSFKRKDAPKVAELFGLKLREELKAQEETKTFEAGRVKGEIEDLYQREGDFEARIDVSPLMDRNELLEGLIPKEFPLPNGRTWGPDNGKILGGRNLTGAEAAIKRQGGRLSFQFFGYRASARRRSELRIAPEAVVKWAERSGTRSTLLIDADDLARFSDPEQEVSFKSLFTSQKEVRLVVYNDRGQIPQNRALDSLLELPNVFRVDTSAEIAFQRYGMPANLVVHLSKAGRDNPRESFSEPSFKRVKFFQLGEEPGVIAVAVLYAKNGGALPGITEKDGFMTVHSQLLALIEQEYLSELVVAWAA
jgi:hypothetical protein